MPILLQTIPQVPTDIFNDHHRVAPDFTRSQAALRSLPRNTIDTVWIELLAADNILCNVYYRRREKMKNPSTR